MEYNNASYVLAGLVIEQATGRPVSEALREQILDPLKLHDAVLGRASAATRSTNLEDPFSVDERLSLEDSLRLSLLPDVPTRGDRAIPSWTLGLRG